MPLTTSGIACLGLAISMEELSTSTTLLQGILDASPDAITVYESVRDPQGGIGDMRLAMLNERSVHMLGLPAGQSIGRLFSELAPDPARDEQLGWLLQVARTGEPVEHELPIRRPGGMSLWMRASARRLEDYVVMTYRDITTHKRIEQRVHQQTGLLQTVVDNAPVGIILAEAVYGPGEASGQIVDFRYLLTNQFNADKTGLTVEAMNGRLISELFPGWQSLSLFRTMANVAQTGRAERYTEKYDQFGINAWFEYHLCQQDNGVLLTFSDVTKLKEAELHQQQQTDLLQTVVNNSPAGIVLYEAVRDDQGQIVDFTHALSNAMNGTITGRPASELVGVSLLEQYPTNRENGFFNDLVRVAQTGEPLRRLMEYRAHGINGWFDSQYTKQGDGVLFTYLDVTKLKEAELHQQQQARALGVANRELARSNNNLQSFAYVASHDLQEPLRKIISFGGLLRDEYAGGLETTGQTYVTRMQTAAERMSLLIKDLLAYSRLSTEHEPFQPVPLNQLVNEVLDDLEVAVDEAGASVSVDRLPTVEGDSVQLHQLFQNLLGNALKFRRPGIVPAIRIESRIISEEDLPADSSPALLTDSLTSRLFYEISVIDNGIGFEEQHRDRIFQVFQRLHGRSQYTGSGVGLAITKRVAENHGGTITAHGRPGNGATFRVYLPV